MFKILGVKLRKSREDLGLTQQALAKAVGLSSEFISMLELGKRMPSLESLTTIASYFKKDISYFLEEKETAFNALFRAERLDKKTLEDLKKFKKNCEEYAWLEEITERRLELAPLYSNISPERMADEERRRLGLVDEPIRDIFSLIEINGCHIIRQPIPEKSQISGVFIFSEINEAAFALINCAQSLGRQILTAAHEYCHYLKDRNAGPIIDNTDIFLDEYLTLYHPREKFAQTFAARLLMPLSKVKEIVEKDIGSNRLNFEDILYLRRYFGVSTLAMLRTLKDLEYLSLSKFSEYRKLDPEHSEEVFFGNLTEDKRLRKEKGRPIHSDRFKRVALEAYRKKKISAEKLSKLLGRDKAKIQSTIGK